MNAQLIFDVVLYGIRAQGGPSSNGIGGCYYRTESGRRCAVGMWISDADYHPVMEGKTVDTLIEASECKSEDFAVKVPGWFREHLPLLRDLQKAHDLSTGDSRLQSDELFLREFESKMCSLASKYNLRYHKPEAIPVEAIELYKELRNAQRTTLPSSAGCNDVGFNEVSTQVFPLACLSMDSGWK
jgi:hypothetical protein